MGMEILEGPTLLHQEKYMIDKLMVISAYAVLTSHMLLDY